MSSPSGADRCLDASSRHRSGGRCHRSLGLRSTGRCQAETEAATRKKRTCTPAAAPRIPPAWIPVVMSSPPETLSARAPFDVRPATPSPIVEGRARDRHPLRDADRVPNRPIRSPLSSKGFRAPMGSGSAIRRAAWGHPGGSATCAPPAGRLRCVAGSSPSDLFEVGDDEKPRISREYLAGWAIGSALAQALPDARIIRCPGSERL